MLETRELYKVYKPKKGVPVTAINKVSLKFPETGMVFLLGKSGSGKSTLLNLLGGLDKYDGGEIIIKNVSSKDFNQQSFDSYRNTYVGFIFQEYNILEEFSVGANIALALELQGKKATDEEINKILKEVDLEGYGNRKPNELSGGQKQRVAIARALVKNPEIIMADEPTGALDSNTGKQVFDTLKKLSKEKLVIIVSHDREFSEQYADRIIELADGQVISDVSLATHYDFEFSKNTYDDETKDNIVFAGNTIEVARGYHLTEEDRIAINKYIDDLNSGKINIEISTNQIENKTFVETKQDEICNELSGKPFKLIKSKLPLKNAFKIGASALKYKKFRLVMTILLSFVAFTLFGIADTLGSYNHINACTNSIYDNGVNYLSLVKGVKKTYGIEEYYEEFGNFISKEEMDNISKMLGIEFTGVYTTDGERLTIYNMGYDKESSFLHDIYLDMFSGFAEIDQNSIDALGYKLLAGKLPDGNKNEVAISKLAYESFVANKYTERKYDDEGKEILIEINKYEDLIGKNINVNGVQYEITGIIDTNFNFDRYKQLIEMDEYMSETEELAMYALYNEYNYEAYSSLTGALMTGKGFVDKYKEEFPRVYSISNAYVGFWSETDFYLDPSYVTTFDKIDKEDVIWLNGAKTELADNEIIVTLDALVVGIDGIEFGENDEIIVPDIWYETLKNIELYGEIYSYDDDVSTNLSGVKIVGILPVSLNKFEVNKYSYNLMVTNENIASKCVSDMVGIYQYIVGAMPKDKDEIRYVVEKTTGSEADVKYLIQNSVIYDLDMLNVIVKAIAKVAFYVGIGFAVFASLMLANFIGISISHKKQEIGILRAIGARSNDVFTIFFSESFVIAIVNFILAAIATFSVTNIINNLINEEIGLLVTVLDFGPRQLALLFGVSVAVAALASFVPVMKIASKRPIDAIRKR